MKNLSSDSFPPAFVKRVQALPGIDSQALLEAIASETAPVSVRYNRAKMPPVQFSGEQVPWCSTGVYLHEAQRFITDPFWHAGNYYVQEASSMVLWAILDALYANIPKPELVLDLCAAPGGKSTLISDWLGEEGVLVANEIIPKRFNILAENMCRWGQGIQVLTNTRVETFINSGLYFDLMVVDAPCSGEGLFRKDPKAMNEWTPESNVACSIRQKDMVEKAWQRLKPGGYMIYSTCTFSTLENEDVLNHMVNEHGASIVTPEFPEAWGFVKSDCNHGHGYRAYPHLVQGEGFFTGVLQKAPGDLLPETADRYTPDSYRFFRPVAVSGTKNATPKKSKHRLPASIDDERKLFAPFENQLFYQNRDTIFAFPENWKSMFEQLNEALPVKWAGVPIFQVNNSLKQPHVGLALHSKSAGAFDKATLNLEDSLSYLRGNALPFDRKSKEPYLVAAYAEQALGWVKNAGKRLNNLHPKSWRIKHY